MKNSLNDFVSQEELQALLPNIPLCFLQETTSTNNVAKTLAASGAQNGTLVVAAKQTAGRGRLGRSFKSPKGGLYMSILLRPQKGSLPEAGLLTAGTAVSVRRAVKKMCNIDLSIKWVNDLFNSGKKCCGILAETVWQGSTPTHCIVGIGLNYTIPESFFTGELKSVATSLYPSGNIPASPANLISQIYAEFIRATNILHSESIIAEYRRFSAVVGYNITVMDTPPYTAKAIGIDDNAGLIILTEAGEEKTLRFGEVSVRL